MFGLCGNQNLTMWKPKRDVHKNSAHGWAPCTNRTSNGMMSTAERSPTASTDSEILLFLSIKWISEVRPTNLLWTNQYKYRDPWQKERTNEQL
jgi:hypothetical protein